MKSHKAQGKSRPRRINKIDAGKRFGQPPIGPAAVSAASRSGNDDRKDHGIEFAKT
jgi:hypothetical protein